MSKSFYLLSAGFFAALFLLPSCTKEQPIKIGVLASLTGVNSASGKRAWEGMKLAQEEINSQGGVSGRRIVTFIEDDMSVGKDAVATVNRFTEVDKVDAIAALVSGKTLELIAPQVWQSGDVMFSSFAVSAVPAPAGTFQEVSSATVEGLTLAKAVIENLKAKKFSIIYVDDMFGRVSAEAFKRLVLEKKGSIEFYDLFQPGMTDFKGYVESMRQHPSDALFIIGSGKEVSAFLVQAREKGINQLIITSYLAVPELVERAKKAAEGVVFLGQDLSIDSKSEPTPGSGNRRIKSLDTFAAEGYDMMHIIARAAQAGGPGASGFKKGLESIKTFDGINGIIKVVNGSSPMTGRQFMIIKNGGFVPLDSSR